MELLEKSLTDIIYSQELKQRERESLKYQERLYKVMEDSWLRKNTVIEQQKIESPNRNREKR